MIDPLLSLAISVQSNKGVYALLLGSGISRAAGIPTGWEVVLDLIRKVATAEGADCEPDPAAWYEAKAGQRPDYATLLGDIGKSQPERMQLLRSYFEPNEDEREQGLKVPTPAHKAIAELVVGGYIRVIVTTNFDRLMEQALEAAGVVPTVLSTADAIVGAIPLVHQSCTILKVHGDYLDPRIKNTPDELGVYEPSVDRLLDQIFDEYGLIVCGWSAEWDTALRAAIVRCPIRRFTTYWTAVGQLRDAAKQLIECRRAQLATILNADAFFTALAEKIEALVALGSSHPLSPKVAAETVKRYLVDERYRIRLHDLCTEESDKVHHVLSDGNFPVDPSISWDGPSLRQRVLTYETVTETLRTMLVTGCYWDGGEYQRMWADCLERVAQSPEDGAGSIHWLRLRAYLALVLLYSAGMAAVTADQYGTLACLLTKATVRQRGADLPIVQAIYTWSVMDQDGGDLFLNAKGHFTPLSEHLYSVLREDFRGLLPKDERYEECFDRFEYLLGLIHVDLSYNDQDPSPNGWGPVGAYRWRHRHTPQHRAMVKVENEAAAAGDGWQPLQAGLFGGSYQRFQKVKAAFDSFLVRLQWM